MWLINIKRLPSFLLFTLLSATLYPNFTHAQQHAKPWQLWRDKNGISLKYLKDNKTKLNEIYACLQTTGTPRQALNFLTQPKSILTWLDRVNSIEEIRKITPSLNVMSTTFSGFGPVKARQAFVESSIFIEDNGRIIINQVDAGEKYHAKEGHIRITLISATWHIIPLPQQKLKICYNVVADPNGSIPHWLANRTALSSMWKTLNNVKSLFNRANK